MDGSDLTGRQQSVLAYVIEYQRMHAISPTVREIAKHLKLHSPSGVHRVLHILQDKGYIHDAASKKRSWRSTGAISVGRIPLVGDIAAGDPIAAIEHVEEELRISPSVFGCDACFGLRVQGDSMIEAHIQDGDLAIIRRQSRVENGEIAAVLVESVLTEATLKMVRSTRSVLTLEPANPNYKPLVFKGPARKRVTIIGKLVGVVRRT
jgi:repressor LexA